MRVLLKKKHEEDELRHSNIRHTYGNPEEEEEEDGCIYIFTKGVKKGQFCGKAVVAKDLCKLHQDI